MPFAHVMPFSRSAARHRHREHMRLTRMGKKPWLHACLAAALATAGWSAQAQAPSVNPAAPTAPALSADPPADPPPRSNLDAQLFFQLLIGEIQWRGGERGAAFEIVLDAARRTKNEQLFLRATEMALQAKAGDQALAAAQSWRATLPQSVAAHHYLVQLYVALNRPQDAVEPLRSLIGISSPEQKLELISALPRFFARLPDRKAAAKLVEDTLEPYAKQAETRTASRVAIARGWAAAEDKTRAWALLQDTHAQDPAAKAPALLALEMMREAPEAETIVARVLERQPQGNDLRLLYARVLTGAQRYADAVAQLELITQAAPEVPGPWLTLGALQVELRHPQEARKALNTYLDRLAAQEAAKPAPGETPSVAQDGGKEAAAQADSDDNTPEKGRTEAWMQLSQADELEKDYAGAEAWLAKVTDPKRATQVQVRRAGILVQRGKLDEALKLVAALPENDEEAAKAKVFAQSQVLRDAKRWKDAYAVLQAANERFPKEPSILYEQSMVAEKLGRFDEMESLLRQVMSIKPEHHFAHNALGYSLADRNLRLAEAKSLIQRALDLSPGDPLITDSLGWVEYRMGNREEALRLLRWAFRARPDAEIGAHLGEVLWVQGQRDEARRVLQEAIVRDAANETLRETLARLKVGL